MKPPKVQNWAVLLRAGAEDYRNSRRFSTKTEKINLTLTPRASATFATCPPARTPPVAESANRDTGAVPCALLVCHNVAPRVPVGLRERRGSRPEIEIQHRGRVRTCRRVLPVPQRILYRCDQHRVTANHFHLLDVPVRCDDYFHFHCSLHSIFFRKFGIRRRRMRNGFPSLRRLRPHRRNQHNGQEQHHQKDKYSLPSTCSVPLHRFASPGAASASGEDA